MFSLLVYSFAALALVQGLAAANYDNGVYVTITNPNDGHTYFKKVPSEIELLMPIALYTWIDEYTAHLGAPIHTHRGYDIITETNSKESYLARRIAQRRPTHWPQSLKPGRPNNPVLPVKVLPQRVLPNKQITPVAYIQQSPIPLPVLTPNKKVSTQRNIPLQRIQNPNHASRRTTQAITTNIPYNAETKPTAAPNQTDNNNKDKKHVSAKNTKMHEKTIKSKKLKRTKKPKKSEKTNNPVKLSKPSRPTKPNDLSPTKRLLKKSDQEKESSLRTMTKANKPTPRNISKDSKKTFSTTVIPTANPTGATNPTKGATTATTQASAKKS